jgi:hypothetical protein
MQNRIPARDHAPDPALLAMIVAKDHEHDHDQEQETKRLPEAFILW